MNEKPTKHELTDLAKIRCSNVEDWCIQLAHATAREDWDVVAQTCTNLQHAVNILAGITGQLLPVVPTIRNDADKNPLAS